MTRPGTYYNPATDMLIVVDDSASIDAEIFDGRDSDDTEWVLLADSTPVDETTRDELIERFSSRHGSGPTGAVDADDDDEDEVDDLDDLGSIDDPDEDSGGLGFDDIDEDDDDYDEDDY